MDRSEQASLLARAVSEDFFGPEGLATEERPSVPAKYQLLRCIGRGGAGTVYLARDRTLGRQVALKFLSEARRSDVERFRREARFAARLNDPAIVQVYEMGETGDVPFIAMQYVDGCNLADAELPHQDLVRTLRRVVAALHHAHVQGIVHRDLKPENILIDREGRAYLTDFGLARELGGAESSTSQEGNIMGTPAFMSPEQARGEVHAVDARTDVWGLGATLYAKLTGRRPFSAPDLVSLLHAVIHDEPVLPRSIASSIPRSLEAIVLKCLRKDKRERYQNAEQILRDLDRFLGGTAVEFESAAWFERLVGRWFATPPRQRPPSGDADLATVMQVVREISTWDANLYRVSGSLAPALARLDELSRRLDRILEERPDAAWARFYRGVCSFRRGRLAEALEDMERSIDRTSDLAGSSFELGRLYLTLHLREQKLARTHIVDTAVHEDLGATRRRLQQALVAFEEARRLGGDVPLWQIDFARAAARLSESDFSGCVEDCDRILERDPDAEEVWKLRGDALELAGQDPVPSYDRALAVRRSFFEALQAKAEHHARRRKFAQARECLEQIRKIHPELLDACVLEARTHLEESRAHGDPRHLDQGLRCLDQVPAGQESYGLLLARAELALAKAAEESGAEEWCGHALDALRRAQDFEGCQNRVNLMTAQALLARFRHAKSRGRDRATDLGAVLELLDGPAARAPHNEPWLAIRDEAARLSAG
jgi:serine/threonine protein kinase